MPQSQPTRQSQRLHRSTVARWLLGAAADRQALATLAATSGQNLAAVLRRHASAETVGSFTAGVVRLVGAFHVSISGPSGAKQVAAARGCPKERVDSNRIAGLSNLQRHVRSTPPCARDSGPHPTPTYIVGTVLIEGRPVLSLNPAKPLRKPTCAIAMPQNRSTSAGPRSPLPQLNTFSNVFQRLRSRPPQLGSRFGPVDRLARSAPTNDLRRLQSSSSLLLRHVCDTRTPANPWRGHPSPLDLAKVLNRAFLERF